MNWDAIGAVAELVGALAVVATLAYLSIQIRQNTRSMDESRKVERSRNYQQLTELRAHMMSSISDSAELAAIYVKAGKLPEGSIEGLTEEEVMRLRFREAINMMVNGVTLQQYEEGLIDRRAYESSRKVFANRTALWTTLGVSGIGLDLADYEAWIERLDRIE